MVDFFDAGGDVYSYLNFLTFNNPARAATLAKLLMVRTIRHAMQIPDILTDAPGRKEFYEIKPDSAASRPKGVSKVLNLTAFYGVNGLPYVPGTSYSPTPELPLGRVHKIEFFLRPRLDRPGLILYNVCVRGPVTELALAAIIPALLALLAGRTGVRIVGGGLPAPVAP